MSTYVNIALDTTGPAAVAASVNGGAAKTTARDVSLAVTTSDGSTNGYQVKIWGSVDLAANPSVQGTEGASAWITLASPHSVRVSNGDGAKTLNVRIRDDVWNESGVASDSIVLDTSAPVPNITAGPTPAKVSKIAGKRTSSLTWSADADWVAYEIRVVPSSGSDHTAGALIGTAGGSTNTGGAGAFTAGQPITTNIDGADLEAASPGDGAKVVKVFVQDDGGNWSA